MTAPTKEPGTALAAAKERPAYVQMLERAVPQFSDFLPEGVRPERVIATVRMAVATNPKIAECTPASILQSVGRAMQLDLEIGITAYLIPRNVWNPATKQKEMTCTILPDYRAHIEMIVRSGAARGVEADVVREGDHFEFKKGTTKFLDHVPRSSTAPITHSYAIVRKRFGDFDFVVLTREQVEAIRAKSQGWNDEALEKKREPKGLDAHPWYAIKSAVIRVCNLVPKNPRLSKWLADAERVTEGDALEMLANPAALAAGPSHPTPLRPADADDPYAHAADGFDPETGEVQEDQ